MLLTLEEVISKSNIIFDAQKDDMVSRQNAYFESNGVYFQGLDIVLPYPDDGEELAPNNLSSKPTDQADGWTASDFPPIVPSSLRIDVYDGSMVGYICTLSFRYSGDLWQRKVGFADCEKLSKDWQIVPSISI